MKDAVRGGDVKDARNDDRRETAGSDDIVVMGRIQGPHGIKGSLKARAFTESLETLVGYPNWWWR